MRLSLLAVCFLFSCKGAMGPIEKLGDEVCACKDVACAEEKMAKLPEVAKTASAGMSDKDLKEFADKLEEQRGRMRKCITEVRGDAAPPAGHGGEEADAPADH